MQLLDLSLRTPEENLACDEALLDRCEREGGPEVLRVWQPASAFVVVGYGQRVRDGVYLDRCAEMHVPVLRRCTGGGTVVQAPGCFNYSVVLRTETRGRLASIAGTTTFVLEKVARAVGSAAGKIVEVRGSSDLVIDDRKVGGNAQRRHARTALVHGCLLLAIEVDLVESLLPIPERQPEYRRSRTHTQFLQNLYLAPDVLREGLAVAWCAEEGKGPPVDEIARRVRERYSRPEWTNRR